MQLELQLKVDSDGRRVLKVQGALNATTSIGFEQLLMSEVARCTEIVLDLSGLKYITSAGLRVIFTAHSAMISRNGKLLIQSPTPQVKRVLEIVRSTSLSEKFESSAEADLYLDIAQRGLPKS